MKIISPDQLVITDISQFKPYDRYVVADCEFDTLRAMTPRTNWTWSSFNSYERRYGGQDLNGKKVCIYRHSAFGDQLMVSALPKYLKSRFPDATVHLYCHSSVHSLWYGNPFVDNSAISLPIPFDAMRRYDYHIFFEGMLEGNSEDDQSCCYDDMFGFCGLKDVPDVFKRPHVLSRPEDNKTYISSNLVNTKYLLYHLSPANPNRMYPWGKGKQFIELFLRNQPNYKVVIVGQKKQATGDDIQLGPLPEGVIDMTDVTKDFRQLIPFIENARCVVCPDSSIMHLSACFPDVPVVSLWGLFNPNDRAKYYPNSYPIFLGKEVCPHAPCRCHNFELPVEQCKDCWSHRDVKQVKACAVLQKITPELIYDLVREVL